MINPNRQTSEDALRRLKEASYERMRVELKNSVELKMKEFDMTWDDIGRLLGAEKPVSGSPSRAARVQWKFVQGHLTLEELNALAHLFSCEPYILFRPRNPWTQT